MDCPSEIGWRATIVSAALAGLLVIILYAAGQDGGVRGFLTTATVGLLTAGAGLMVGSLVGFLFGIPRSLQGEDGDQSTKGKDGGDGKVGAAATDERRGGSGNRYGANTNLEQISDWLSKILVGVGLTQLTKLSNELAVAADYVARALVSGCNSGNPPASAEGLAYASLVYFPMCGFLFTYLWSRIYLAKEFSTAGLAFDVARVEKKVDAQLKQAQIDASALSLAVRQMQPDPNSPMVPEGELTEAIKQASPSVKAQIFYQAQKIRRDNWEIDKAFMKQTIPVFRALVASDPEGRFHQNYGQLGYALKDQLTPQWGDAEAAFTSAIRIRDGVGEGRWWRRYEFNRAVCKIVQDSEFQTGAASSPKVRAEIIADLSVLNVREAELLKGSPVAQWIALNNVTVEEVKALGL